MNNNKKAKSLTKLFYGTDDSSLYHRMTKRTATGETDAKSQTEAFNDIRDLINRPLMSYDRRYREVNEAHATAKRHPQMAETIHTLSASRESKVEDQFVLNLIQQIDLGKIRTRQQAENFIRQNFQYYSAYEGMSNSEAKAVRAASGSLTLPKSPYQSGSMDDSVIGKRSERVRSKGPLHITFPGSGPLPMTAILLHKKLPNCHLNLIDIDHKAIDTSKKLFDRLSKVGYIDKSKFSFYKGDACTFNYTRYTTRNSGKTIKTDVLFLANLIPPFVKNVIIKKAADNGEDFRILHRTTMNIGTLKNPPYAANLKDVSTYAKGLGFAPKRDTMPAKYPAKGSHTRDTQGFWKSTRGIVPSKDFEEAKTTLRTLEPVSKNNKRSQNYNTRSFVKRTDFANRAQWKDRIDRLPPVPAQRSK